MLNTTKWVCVCVLGRLCVGRHSQTPLVIALGPNSMESYFSITLKNMCNIFCLENLTEYGILKEDTTFYKIIFLNFHKSTLN